MKIAGPTGREERATRSSTSSSSTWTRPRSARWYLITIKCDANICCWFKIEFPFPGWGIYWRKEEMRYCGCWCTTGNWAFGNVTIYLWGEIYLTGCIWILTKMTNHIEVLNFLTSDWIQFFSWRIFTSFFNIIPKTSLPTNFVGANRNCKKIIRKNLSDILLPCLIY